MNIFYFWASKERSNYELNVILSDTSSGYWVNLVITKSSSRRRISAVWPSNFLIHHRNNDGNWILVDRYGNVKVDVEELKIFVWNYAQLPHFFINLAYKEGISREWYLKQCSWSRDIGSMITPPSWRQQKMRGWILKLGMFLNCLGAKESL